MATSGSIDFSTSRDNIITDALQMIGVVADGDSPTSDQITTANRFLNMMVKSWNAKGINLFGISSGTIDLVASTGSYTLSPRAMKIIYAVRRDSSNNDTPLIVGGYQDYIEITDKYEEGTPIAIYYNPQVGTSNVAYIHYVPENTDYDIVYWYSRTLEDFDSSSDEPDFPQEWYLPLVLNLASILGLKYGVPVELRDRIQLEANTALEIAEGFDREISITFGVDNV